MFRHRHIMESTMQLLKFYLLTTIAVVGMTGCTNFEVESRGVFALNGERAGFTPSGPYERGKAHLKSGHLGLAVRAFRAAIARGQDTVKTLNALAATYDLLGRVDLSAEYYDRALLRDPNSVQTLNNKGYSYLLQNDLASASRYLAAAQRLDPTNEMVVANLVLVEAAGQEKTAATPAKVVTADFRPFASQTADAMTPESAPPNAWIERTGAQVQTLVTRPDPRVVTLVNETGVDPRLAAVSSRYQTVVATALASLVGTLRIMEPARGYRLEAGLSRKSVKVIHDLRERSAPNARQRKSERGSDRQAKIQADTLASPVKQSDGPRFALARVEVSNGAGRGHMAARMRAHLRSKGISVVRLTNAKSFSNMTTVIFYHSGFEAEADAIARLLPEPVTLKHSHDGKNPVRVRLGGDLLDFDKTLIAEFGHEGNENVGQS